MRFLKKLWRDLAPILVVLVLLMGARSSIADHYVVPTGSMEYSVLPGDRVLVDKTAYGVRVPFLGWQLTSNDGPERGEVVVFDSPEDGTRLVKRVVAISGDVVAVRSGWLFINGERLADSDSDEPIEIIGDHIALLNLSRGGGPDIGPFEIPAGELLVMGDARGNSRDGRVFGTIDASIVYGRVIAVFFRAGEGLVWQPL